MSADDARKSAFATMALSVMIGGAVGGGIGVAFLPYLAAALAIGGAMTGGAIGAARLLFAGADE